MCVVVQDSARVGRANVGAFVIGVRKKVSTAIKYYSVVGTEGSHIFSLFLQAGGEAGDAPLFSSSSLFEKSKIKNH